MALNNTILVLTQQLDFHANLVIAELNRRSAPVVRFDTADFPRRATLIAHSQRGSWEGAIVTEHYTPFQLKVASECGLEIPASLITKDSGAVLDFFERFKGEMIYKILSGGMIVAESGEVVSVNTSRVTRDDLRDEGNRVRYTACLFQELVPKKVELRITVVGEHVFPAEISYTYPERAAVDWRTAYQDLQYGTYQLPQDIRHKCLALVYKLGLPFAAIDMIVTPDDRYVFLEVNPDGQWQWIERATGFPICETLVDLLVAGKKVQ